MALDIVGSILVEMDISDISAYHLPFHIVDQIWVVIEIILVSLFNEGQIAQGYPTINQ